MIEFPYSENPAANPTRAWNDSAAVRRELTMWLKKMPDNQKEFLRDLVEHPSGALDDDTLTTARAINKIAEAFGFVSLVVSDDDGTHLAAGAREPLIALGMHH
jgi:hypothetical protein